LIVIWRKIIRINYFFC